MSRLPTDFVKPPAAAKPAAAAATAAPKRSTKRRPSTTAGKTATATPATRLAAAVAAPVKHALALTGEVVLVLKDDERKALGAALDELRRAGHEVTLEQMVSRVIADWMARRAAPPAAPRRTLEAAVAKVRELAASPLATWRELGTTLRRSVRTAAAVVAAVRG